MLPLEPSVFDEMLEEMRDIERVKLEEEAVCAEDVDDDRVEGQEEERPLPHPQMRNTQVSPEKWKPLQEDGPGPRL